MMLPENFNHHGEFVPDRKIQIHHEPWRDRLVIYSRIGQFKDGYRLYGARDPQTGNSQLFEVAPNAEPPIYLILGQDEADAIVQELEPRPDATARHLDDAMDVRDRLLTMIEKQDTVRMIEVRERKP